MKPANERHILITNDDGILAPGLAALIDAAKGLGTLHIVAPSTPQSAAGHSITLMDPLMCHTVTLPTGHTGYGVAGRPADCVKLAMTELLDVQPDLVLSGINAGANVGVNVLYSGTVAAAIEAAFFGVPAVALSLAFNERVDFDYAAEVARDTLNLLDAKGVLQPGRVLNVNIPPCDIGKPLGVRVVRQATQAWATRFHRRTDPRNRLYFWLDTDARPEITDGDGTDEQLIHKGFISVTPLQVDLTDSFLLDTIAPMFNPPAADPNPA